VIKRILRITEVNFFRNMNWIVKPGVSTPGFFMSFLFWNCFEICNNVIKEGSGIILDLPLLNYLIALWIIFL
jgi:hypothetical protein